MVKRVYARRTKRSKLATVKGVKRMIAGNIETKNTDIVVSSGAYVPYMTSGTSVVVCDTSEIATGDLFYERTGSEIRMQHLDLDFYCWYNNATTNGAITNYRLIIYQVLHINAGSNPIPTRNNINFVNINDRLDTLSNRILYDSGVMPCSNQAGALLQSKYKRRINLRNQKLTYGAANATIADRNNIMVVVMTDVSANKPQYYLSYTLFFKDA